MSPSDQTDKSDLPPESELWRRLLLGTDPSVIRLRRRHRRIPSPPRCEILVTAEAATLAGGIDGREHRSLQLRGKSGPTDVVVVTVGEGDRAPHLGRT